MRGAHKITPSAPSSCGFGYVSRIECRDCSNAVEADTIPEAEILWNEAMKALKRRPKRGKANP